MNRDRLNVPPSVGEQNGIVSNRDNILVRASKDPNLKREELRVLTFLVGSFGAESEFRVIQDEIAKLLGMHRPQVCRAFQKLEHYGFIEKTKARHYCLTVPSESTSDEDKDHCGNDGTSGSNGLDVDTASD